MKLNLGCGGRKLPGYINVDSEAYEAPDVLVDLGRAKWPWPDDSVDEMHASHVLEHLPGETFFHFLREAYRVGKPGAKLHVALPWPRHDIFLNDPTHVRAVMPATLLMFSQRYVQVLAERDPPIILTDFGKRNGINLDLDENIQYRFDPAVMTDGADPEELERRGRHENNVIFEWFGVLTVVK